LCALAVLLPFAALGAPQSGGPAPQGAGAPAGPAPRPPGAAPDAKLSDFPEANGLLHLGAVHTAHGDYATAEICYRQILDGPEFQLGDKKTALLGLAHMYRKSGELTKSAAIYEKFLQQFPDDGRVPDAYLDLGRTLREMGAFDLALNRFYSVINSTLKLPSQGFEHYSLLAKTAQFEIAQTYYQAGDFDQAGQFFSRVRLLDLAPADRARANFMMGCAQENAGDFDSAITTLRKYLSEWPNDENVPEARYVLATALGSAGQNQEALSVTLQLLRAEKGRVAADPRRWNYWQRRAGNQLANAFFQNGDLAGALTIYNGLSALSNEPSWRLPVLYQVGLCYEGLHQTDHAREAYQSILDAVAKQQGSAPPPASTTELTQMAAWRIQQLGWRDDVNRRVTTLLAPGVRPPPNHPPPPTPPES
jgi:tetratricopeptide (TPR) repeat protein